MRQATEGDRKLVSRARDGEDDARDLLARQVGDSAYVFALQLTGQPDTARDIAQDAVLRFFRHLDRFDSDRPIEPWLFASIMVRFSTSQVTSGAAELLAYGTAVVIEPEADAGSR